MNVRSKALVAIVFINSAFTLPAGASCKNPQTREEKRICSNSLPEAKAVLFRCEIKSGDDILKTVNLKAYDRLGAQMRAVIENVAIETDAPVLKEEVSTPTMDPYVSVVSGVKCVQQQPQP